MSVQIEGEYESDQGVVRIAYERDAYRTLYSRSGKAPNLPTFQNAYRIDIGDDLAGYGYFREARLAGEFRSKSLGDPQWLNGAVTFVNPERITMPIFGYFVATLREDGAFDVVIDHWGGKGGTRKPKRQISPRIFEPEAERIETTWVRRV